MGVAGSGKTTIAQLLAAELGWRFEDADRLHTAASVEKMRAGVGLVEADRQPWLELIRREVIDRVAPHDSLVLACSALKKRHRLTLAEGCGKVRFVYLRITPELASVRLRARTSHFMNPVLVGSQFADLEEPADAITIDASRSPRAIVADIIRELKAPELGAVSSHVPAGG